MNIEYIDQPQQLPDLIRRIEVAEWIALDTEFLRIKTYYPVFCLLQIATADWVVCVDPLAIADLSALFAAINNPKTVKVFHACSQDLEIFYNITGAIPKPLFDTQIAAPLLGVAENSGYAALVAYFLQIKLSKAHNRADWSIRPLQPAQIQYAADDVIYLGKIYQLICDKLAQLGRIDWLDECFLPLENPPCTRDIAANAWQKIKGKQKLTAKQLSMLQALAKWRETTAQRQNRPKSWIIRDDLLLELAKNPPSTPTDFAKVYGMKQHLVKLYGSTICQLLRDCQGTPPPTMATTKSRRKTPQQEAVLDVLTAVVKIHAVENSISPLFLAERKNLEKLLWQEDNPLLHGWRYGMIGKELQAVLAGQQKITINNQQIVLSAS